MRHVVMFSGGVGSWAAAKRVAERHGADHLTLLFTDTLIEDEDLYRFLVEAAANVGGQLVRIAEGRTPWEVFRDRRFLGNSRVDLCSRVLKREMAERWLTENRDPDPSQTTLYVGIDWTESHRYVRLRSRWLTAGWSVEAPLCEAPYLSKDAVFALLAAEGIALPRLYAMGFAHNNCGGGCVKAGQGHFAHLLATLPDVYAEWERNEAAIATHLGKSVTILKDRTGGRARPLSLVQLRRRIEDGAQIDMYDIGGCGCFVDTEAA